MPHPRVETTNVRVSAPGNRGGVAGAGPAGREPAWRRPGQKPCDEVLRVAGEFALAQAAQADGRRTAGEAVGAALHGEQVGRPGEQEPAGAPVPVDAGLDRQQEFRFTLDLVDHQHPVGGLLDEGGLVSDGRVPGPPGLRILADAGSYFRVLRDVGTRTHSLPHLAREASCGLGGRVRHGHGVPGGGSLRWTTPGASRRGRDSCRGWQGDVRAGAARL